MKKMITTTPEQLIEKNNKDFFNNIIYLKITKIKKKLNLYIKNEI